MSGTASPPSVITIPVRQTAVSALMSIRQRAAQNAIAIVRAVTQIADLIARDLSPSDVNGSALGRLSNPNALTANVALANQFSSFTLSNTQACAIYGYVALSALPLIDQLTIGLAGAGTFGQLQLDSLYNEQVPTAVFEPIYFQPNETVQIGLLAGAAVAANAEQFLLLGVMAEQAGKTVNTPREVLGGYTVVNG